MAYPSEIVDSIQIWVCLCFCSFDFYIAGGRRAGGAASVKAKVHKQTCTSFGLQTATSMHCVETYLWEKFQIQVTHRLMVPRLVLAQALASAGIALKYQMITKAILHDHTSTSQPHIWISSIVAMWLVLMDLI